MAEASVPLVIADSSVECCGLDLVTDTAQGLVAPVADLITYFLHYLALEVPLSNTSVSQRCRWVPGSLSSRMWQPSHRVSMIAEGGPLSGSRAWQPISEPLVLPSIQPRSLRIRTCCKLQASSAPTLQEVTSTVLCCGFVQSQADEFGEHLIHIGSSIACFPHHSRSLGAKAGYRTQLLLRSCWPIYYCASWGFFLVCGFIFLSFYFLWSAMEKF